MVVGSGPVSAIKISDIAPISSKKLLDIQVITENEFILNVHVIWKHT